MTDVANERLTSALSGRYVIERELLVDTARLTELLGIEVMLNAYGARQ